MGRFGAFPAPHDLDEGRLEIGKSDYDAESIHRAHDVEIVSAISAFEGGQPSDFYAGERTKYLSGEISARELAERTVNRWKR